MCEVRGESLFFKVDDFVTYLVVTCNGKCAIRETQRVIHGKVLHATVTFVLDIGGVKVVTSI